MKLSKKSEAEVMQVYNAYWENYLKGDVKAMILLLDDNYTQVGSAETEVFFNKKDAVQFLYDTIDQVAGKLEMRNRSTKLEQLDTNILLHELCDVYVLMSNEWNFYSKFRASTLMQKKEMGWKIIHQHSSMPDIRAQEGENIAIEKISKENLELREAVKRRTIELEHKNHELEIEGSLERVRARALSMKKPDDLPGICETLFEELRNLGFSEIRNAMINIHNDANSSFLNYDYSDTIGKSITHLFYNTHPLVEKQIKQIRSSSDAFSETSFRGKELDEWIAFRKKKGEKDDPRLENISALFYYFYSIGTGSIGISTFGAISDQKLKVLKQFRNVFDFAYSRYIELTQAEAQAYEARIEASLERIRAQAMSMRRPDELASVGKTIFTELKSLGFNDLRNTEIILNNDQKESVFSYYCDYGVTGTVEVFYKTNPIVQQWVEDLKKASNAFAAVEIPEKEMDAWRTFRESIGYLPDPQLNAAKIIYYYSYSIGLGALSISSFIAISDDQIKTLERFRNVFDLAYRRFIDVTQAEAQAREAQIELSLERVRARTMAMQHSDELKEAAIILFEQMNGLGVHTGSCGFNIWDQKEKSSRVWMSSAEGGLQEPFTLPHTESPIYTQVYDSIKAGNDFLVIEVSNNNLKKHFDYLLKLPGIGDVIKKRRASGYQFPETMVFHFAFFAQGYLSFHLHEHHPETNELFKRFAKVFEQTYTRFLDLQKAEAQAREAKIEAALEKVRGRAMAMHNSNDLTATASIVFSELRKLGIHPIRSGVGLLTQEAHQVLLYAATSSSESDALALVGPIDMSANHCLKIQYESCLKKENYFPVLSGEELKAYYKELAHQISVPFLTEEQFRHEQYGYYFPFSEGYFYAWTDNAYSEDEINILNRFKSIIDLTFRRYLDLQKAEAQAREAQIEAALERVRSRTMGMQKSAELKEVIQVVYEQFVHLNITIGHTGFVIDYKARNDYNIWIADPLGVPSEVTIRYFDSVYYNQFNEAKEKGIEFFATNLTFEEKNKFYQKLFEYIPGLTQEAKEFYFSCPGLAASTVLLENVCLYIENFSGIPYSDEENATLMRFGKVFQQTYTRFLDLQKAEAQARESQIEAALEKVRSRSLAMHKSDELKEAGELLWNELGKLGIQSLSSGYVLMNKEEKIGWIYAPNPATGKIAEPLGVLHTETKEMLAVLSCWKRNDPLSIIEMNEQETIAHQTFIAEQSLQIDGKILNWITAEQLITLSPKRLFLHNFNFKQGYLLIVGGNRLTEKQIELMLRFTNVFQQTYTRFLDLKMAEAQAREAKIETSLERIRARGLAMHTSEELVDASTVLFNELKTLGIETIRTGVGIVDSLNETIEVWSSELIKQKENKILGVVPAKAHPFFEGYYDAWKGKQPSFSMRFTGEEVKEFYATTSAFLSYPDRESYNPGESISVFFFPEGSLNVVSQNPLTDNECQLMNRFARVFGLIYTRFLDLKQAEAQAREAQIEVALERVRSRTLAMHKSDELAETATVLFQQLIQLGIDPNRLYITLIHDGVHQAEFWITGEDGSKVSSAFFADLDATPTFVKMFEGWQQQKKSIVIDMTGQELQEYFQYLSKLNVPFKDGLLQTRRVQHIAYFAKGYIGMASPEPQPIGTIHLLERFAAVFNLTYTRFNDLQVAEANAKNAQVEEQKLREEKKRSDSLLLNILPEEIANELKQFGKSYARKHEEVTILFADIKGFSSIAETLPADVLVAQLDECFRAFDNIVEKHGLEKIKTVGDAYVCACGLPKPVPGNAIKTVQAAMDMLDFLKGFGTSKKIQNLPAFEFRIGIHTGPVVTGVVGLKKFTYDIWGDAVNMAARMEQHGEPGKINVSGNTYKFIKDKFTCTHRGKIEAKNKGEIDMYFVEHLN